MGMIVCSSIPVNIIPCRGYYKNIPYKVFFIISPIGYFYSMPYYSFFFLSFPYSFKYDSSFYNSLFFSPLSWAIVGVCGLSSLLPWFSSFFGTPRSSGTVTYRNGSWKATSKTHSAKMGNPSSTKAAMRAAS